MCGSCGPVRGSDVKSEKVTTMTTTVLLALGAIVMLVLVGRWVYVTRRDIDASRDRALQAHLDWRIKRREVGKTSSALRF